MAQTRIPKAQLDTTLVDTTSSQTITGKTISGASNTITNISLTTGVTGTLPVANGGTGQTSFTNGQLLIGNTTGNTLTVGTLTAGTGVVIGNGGGSITINAAGGGLSWTNVTGTTQTAVVNNGYITNNVALVTVTLPSTAAIGSTIKIVGLGAGGWKVAQAASVLIHMGTSVTTTGTGGSLASVNQYDAVELICTVANTTWSVVSSQGNITVV